MEIKIEKGVFSDYLREKEQKRKRLIEGSGDKNKPQKEAINSFKEWEEEKEKGGNVDIYM